MINASYDPSKIPLTKSLEKENTIQIGFEYVTIMTLDESVISIPEILGIILVVNRPLTLFLDLVTGLHDISKSYVPGTDPQSLI